MVPDALTRDIGPLPVWGWLGAGVAGVVIGRKLGGSFGGSSDSPTASEGAGGTFAGIGSTGSAVGLAQRAPAAAPVAGQEEPQSNREWRSRALTKLIALGYEPLAADQALANYLAGRQPSPDDEEAVEVALREVGLPPSPPTIIPSQSPAVPTVTTTGEPDRVRGDRLSEIVREAYIDVLGREPEQGGLEFWRGELASGKLTPTTLRIELAKSVEFEGLLL